MLMGLSKLRAACKARDLFALCAAAPLMPALGAELSRLEIEQSISQANGNRLDLSSLDLSGDLSGLKLRRADSFSSDPSGANLSGADLNEANFTRADLRRTRLSNANLRAAILYAVLMHECDFSSADLSRARIIGGGRSVSFENAKLVGADPANQGMVPVRAELPEASFNGADLTAANLTHAALSSAAFQERRSRARVSITPCWMERAFAPSNAGPSVDQELSPICHSPS